MNTEESTRTPRRYKRGSLIILVVLVVVLVGAGVFLRPVLFRDASSSQAANTGTAADVPTKIQLYQEAIQIYSWGLSPAGTVKIKSGDSVAWINKSRSEHRIVSDSGPVSFQGQAALQNDDMYLVTFTTPGTYTFHDESEPSFKGTIIIE